MTVNLQHNPIPFKAKILVFGFIRAESAVIGLLKGCIGIFISIITTLFCGAVSRTHIYLSDSIVTFVKVINCGLIPMLVNCNFTSNQAEFRSQPFITLGFSARLIQRSSKVKNSQYNCILNYRSKDKQTITDLVRNSGISSEKE